MFRTSYRKIGGIHWLAIGDFRISFCRKTGATAKPAKARRAARRADPYPALTFLFGR